MKLKVGMLVRAVPPFRLATGCGRYDYAIVVSVKPLALASETGDMLWFNTLYPGCVEPIGYPFRLAKQLAMRRWKEHLKHKVNVMYYKLEARRV